ncbi:MAG: YiiX/YebB-like N1pC/P60 family cysteine hydrolase [Myxococcota bacterium]
MSLRLSLALSFGAFALAFLWLRSAPSRALAEREASWGTSIQEGDLVFQDLRCGRRCALIREITESNYTHVGVVLGEGGERVVWEAFGPVGPTPLAEWVRRVQDGKVAVYRPIEAPRPDELAAALAEMEGRPYDGLYLWDDERIYCSELIAKAYAALGRPFTPRPVSLGRFRAEVERLSQGRLTEGTVMVTPVDLVRSGRFRRVRDELSPTT